MNVNTHQHINLNYLEMMADGDDSMKVVMLEMLLEELPVEVAKMRELTDAGNWSELTSVSHKMKSTLAYVGNDAMTEANKEIELITKDGGDYSKVPGLMDTVETQFNNVLPELKTELANS
ncbi:MAG: Hpt domain-containing protein [Bacteroidota bacterium]